MTTCERAKLVLLLRSVEPLDVGKLNEVFYKLGMDCDKNMQQVLEAACTSSLASDFVDSILAEPAAGCTVWSPEQWQAPVAAQGPALQKIFSDLGFDESVTAMVQAYHADPASNLKLMMEATGCTEETYDINYAWTSEGRMALLLEGMKLDIQDLDIAKSTLSGSCRGEPEASPAFVKYDCKLRSWVADLGMMHEELMRKLETEGNEDELEQFHVKNICEQGDWSRGIAITPSPKFFIVTQWVKKYFKRYYDMANKLTFYKRPGTKAPPFVQVKKHRTCFLFKGRDGPGSVFVNPEFAKEGANELRDDLTDEDFSQEVITVEIIGGKGFKEFPDGLAGKLTCVGDHLFIIPMGPQQTKRFTPHSTDAKEDSYTAFCNSHPVTFGA